MKDDELRHIYDVSLFNISDLDVLLHEILKQTRELLSAEAGTIYISSQNYLKFHVFQNDALSYEEIYRFYHAFKDFKFPLAQYDRYIAVDCYLRKKIIVVDDVYNNTDYDFIGIKEFDAKFKYRTNSMITVPLIHPIENKVLGVVQLLNKKVNGEFVIFDERDKEILSMFSSFISLSISKAQSDVKKLQELNSKLKETNEILETKVEEEIKNNKDKSEIIFHQSKMASMGEMIGNIAHQWREPLNSISAIASAASLDVKLDNFEKEKMVDNLDQIVDRTQKLSTMIDDFKNFYEIDTIKENFNLAQTIKSSLEIADTVLSNNKINVHLRLEEDIEIFGLKNEFIQSILNLITNAKDALMQNISINERRFIFIDLYRNESEIVIKITDNAKGISKEIASNIFDSNTTSKCINSDSGIGLFMTRLIIENHMNGSIAFENISYSYEGEEYEGAQFTIVLS